jgi:hypothetical protein
VGDFNADGKADLAVGVPFKDIIAVRNSSRVLLTDAGEVDVIYGSSAGLSSAHPPQTWTQEAILGAGSSASGNRFGSSLTAWNFGRNEVHQVCVAPSQCFTFTPYQAADLAIGVPFQSVNGLSGAGAVDVIYGSFFSNGLTSGNPNALTATSIGFGSLAGAHFGATLY